MRFNIRTSMPPSRARCDRHVVHELSDEKNAAPARLEHVLGRQGVVQALGIEAWSLVADADDEVGRIGRPGWRRNR